MTIRDLGYKPYEGDRLPASHNTMVLLRHGLRRAWGSWLVKISVFTGWLPTVITMVIVGAVFWFTKDAPPEAAGEVLNANTWVRGIFDWQLWLFISLITIGAGAGAIAEDFQNKAFQFYFAKPVTPVQYLTGRVAAVAFWCFMLTFIPALLVTLSLVGTAPEEVRLERAGLLLPALLQSALISGVVAVGSVGMSSLSKSRALTMSAWILLFLVPHALGSIVYAITKAASEDGEGWPWLLLASIPKLLGVVGDALFKIQDDSPLEWYHAVIVLAGVVAGGIALSFRRLRDAEVIT